MGLNPIEMWDGRPISEEWFVIYLFVISCILLVRMFRLARHVWSFRRKQELLRDEKCNIETVAKSALKYRLEIEGTTETNNSSALLFKVDRVETRFIYLWETCYANIRTTKTLIFLTMTYTFLLTTWEAAGACAAIKAEPTAGAGPIAAGMLEILEIMTAGLTVSAFFYAFSSWFESILFRRRRDWYYFKAKLKEELSSNTSHGTK
jgi:hypothetical protein